MYIYVASPYTHDDPKVMLHRMLEAMKYTASLISDQKWAYSPIVHCHNMARTYNFPVDHTFWAAFDAAMIVPCKEVHVLQIEGWDKSKGVQHEIEFCRLIQKPMKFAYWNDALDQYQTI